MNKSAKKNMWTVILSVALVIVVGVCAYFGFRVVKRVQEQKMYSQIASDDSEFTGQIKGDAPVVPDVFDEKMNNPVNWEKLISYNDELYAWIYIPNTGISYPVAQHGGDDPTDSRAYFYLKHDLYKKWAYCGCIFTQTGTPKDFGNTGNMVIYGHNMENNYMFANLHKFDDKQFFDNNRYFYIYTPEHAYKYEIYARFDTGSFNLNAQYNFFKTKKDCASFLEGVRLSSDMNSHIREEAVPGANDKMVTLSTCITGQPSKRLLVVGVLIDEK